MIQMDLSHIRQFIPLPYEGGPCRPAAAGPQSFAAR